MSAIAIQHTSPISYLFVDGGCVRAELNAMSKHYLGEPGKVRLNWAVIQYEYTKVFYYDALPTRIDGETDQEYQVRNSVMLSAHEELRKLDRFHVYEGDVRRARGRQERAQQKKVDVMIAVDMLLHTFRRNMQSATLIASDLDFAPLLHALIREGMFLTLWYPPAATSAELQSAADSRRHFTAATLSSALLTDDGRPLIPNWTMGVLHMRQGTHFDEWDLEDGRKIIMGTAPDHYMCEITNTGGRTVAYAPHHDPRILLVTAEDWHGVTVPDAAFTLFGGRPD